MCAGEDVCNASSKALTWKGKKKKKLKTYASHMYSLQYENGRARY